MSDLFNKDDFREAYIINKDLKIKELTDFNSYCRDINKHVELINNLENDSDFNQILVFGNAISNEIRLKILRYVASTGATCFCELEALFTIKLSTLNYHVKLLVKAKLLTTSKIGKNIIIKLSDNFHTVFSDELLKLFNK